MPIICFEDIANGQGQLLPAETRLLAPFNTTFLEHYRRVLLDRSNTSPVLAARARSVLWLACSTELRTIFTDLLVIPDAVLAVNLCSRRHVNDIDNDLSILYSELDLALGELGDMGLPVSYLEALTSRATSSSAKHRVSACCAIVMLAATLAAGY